MNYLRFFFFYEISKQSKRSHKSYRVQIKFSVALLGEEGDLIVSIPDHCLSLYFYNLLVHLYVYLACVSFCLFLFLFKHFKSRRRLCYPLKAVVQVLFLFCVALQFLLQGISYGMFGTLSFVFMLLLFAVLFSIVTPRFGKTELVYMLLVHLFVYLACVKSSYPTFVSSYLWDSTKHLLLN